jgi:hypothetical protein
MYHHSADTSNAAGCCLSQAALFFVMLSPTECSVPRFFVKLRQITADMFSVPFSLFFCAFLLFALQLDEPPYIIQYLQMYYRALS